MKKAPSFGMVMLVIVMAVVLLMVAKAWQSTAPAVLDTQRVLDGRPAAPGGGSGTEHEARDGGLPGLGDAQKMTDAHAAQVQEALQAAD